MRIYASQDSRSNKTGSLQKTVDKRERSRQCTLERLVAQET